MHNFTIIITTYNRPQKVCELVNQLSGVETHKLEIIVVDSSLDENEQLLNWRSIIYLRSNHKNQPYQRYIGTSVATGNYILFLDDDMEIVDSEFLVKISQIINIEEPVGLALNFKDKHEDTTLAAVPKSALFHKSSVFRRFKNWFTGYPDLPTATLGLCGNRGKQPQKMATTQYVSGGAFLAKRKNLFQNFNFQLFDLFEERFGMGEDALIGYGIYKQGKLLFVPEIMFLHDDQKDSSYSMNIKDYAKRVLFSRLYLSLEKTRLDEKSLALAKFHFHWYAIWRLFGLLVNYSMKPSVNRKSSFLGAYSGWKMAIKFSFSSALDCNQYWKNEALKNLDNHK